MLDTQTSMESRRLSALLSLCYRENPFILLRYVSIHRGFLYALDALQTDMVRDSLEQRWLARASHRAAM